VARKTRMPSEEELPDGPRRKFVAELRRYYRAAGHPPLRAVSQAVERHQDPRLVKVTASAETVRRMITGKVLPVDRDRVYAVFHVLCEMSEIDPGAPRWDDDGGYCQFPKSFALMSGVLCTWLLSPRRIFAASALGKGSAEFTGRGGHEDAGPEELGERRGDAGGGGQDQGDAADQCQNRGRGHRPWPFAGRRRGAGAGVLLVTGFSFQGRAAPACGRSAFGCSSAGVSRANRHVSGLRS